MSVLKRYNISEANTLTKPLNLQDITVDAGTEARTFTYDASLAFNGINTVTVNPVTASIDSNIIPDNIKKGVTILGVEGNSQGNTMELLCKQQLTSIAAGDFGTATFIPQNLLQQQTSLLKKSYRKSKGNVYFHYRIRVIGKQGISNRGASTFYPVLAASRETLNHFSKKH